MLKIERVSDKQMSGRWFHIRNENSLDYCLCFLTFFGKTYRIKYSAKFNYFYITQQVRRERLLADALTLSFIHQLIQTETNKVLTSLERLKAPGGCGDFFLRGRLEGEDVFIKVTLTRLQTDTKTGGAMQNEYKKGVLTSADCCYFLKPMYYIQSLPCEILITPFIQNLRTLNEILNDDAPAPEWIKKQLLEIQAFLKEKRLVHRDIHGANFVIGNLEHESPHVFLNDLAFMTRLDDNDNPMPLSIENDVRRIKSKETRDDNACFAELLNAIDEKLDADRRKREKKRQFLETICAVDAVQQDHLFPAPHL